MAVWKQKLAGCQVKIHDVDHSPPHCHVFDGQRNMKVDLHLLEVMNPPPHKLSPRLLRALRQNQRGLLKAWEKVRLLPSADC